MAVGRTAARAAVVDSVERRPGCAGSLSALGQLRCGLQLGSHGAVGMTRMCVCVRADAVRGVEWMWSLGASSNEDSCIILLRLAIN